MTDEKPVATNVDSQTHEAAVESKGPEDTVSVEVVKPQGWLVPIVVDLVSRTQPVDIRKHPFVVSVRHLLDHMRSEPKHAALATLLDDCEQQYKNLSRENNHGEVPAESD